MINLNDFRKNIYYDYGVKQCPHYGEDGVILKIFDCIGASKNPVVVEFGEHRSLGTTTRSFRLKYFARSIYFAGDLGWYSYYLNVLDVLKVSFRHSLKYLGFLFNLPFQFFATTENILTLFQKRKVKEIDVLTIDIDSIDYYIAKTILEGGYHPKLLILEYNYSLGYDKKLTYPLERKENFPKNLRAFGASYLALDDLASQHGYQLIHVSGFCNLFYVKKEQAKQFTKPQKNDFIYNNDDVVAFLSSHCKEGFIPSWFNEKELTEKELEYFDLIE